jgi:hypothetical protein
VDGTDGWTTQTGKTQVTTMAAAAPPRRKAILAGSRPRMVMPYSQRGGALLSEI